LYNSAITGGNLTSTNGAEIHGINDSLDGVTITSGSTYSVDPGASTFLTGDLTNHGTVLIGNSGSGANLVIDASTVNLSGGGTINLNNANSFIRGNSGTETLVNQDNLIQGQGQFYPLGLFNNQATVDANVSGGTITIQATTTTNTGTLEATAGGTLEILNSSATNTNGTISTDGSSSSVIIEGSGIIGGNLTSTNGAEIHGIGNALDGVTITSGSTYSVDPGQSTSLTGDLTNDGTILIGNSGGGSILYPAAPTVYLFGDGTVTLNNANSHLRGSVSSDTLVNTDNTIQGQGDIDGLNFINQATVNANVAGGTLTIQAPTTTNTGTLEATGGGTLYFQSSVVTNTNGTISADGSSSSVSLNASTTVTGGNLTSTNGAEIHGTSNSALDGVTITTGSTFSVDAGSNIFLTGDLTNHGTVLIGNSGGNANLVIDAPTVTLSGGGTVILNSGYSYLEGNGTTPSPTLVNEDNTIQGQGAINSSLNFINQATVDANVPGGTNEALTIHAPTSNTGTLEATGGGTLYFQSSVVTNTNGTISTGGSSSSVIISGSAIIGGNLTSASGAEIHAIANSSLDGVTITSGSTLSVDNGSNIYLTGDLTNMGTVVVGGNLNVVPSTATLSGGGTVILNAGSLVGNHALTTLVNKDNTIQGQGTIGALNFTNQGTVNANVAGGTLYIENQGALFTNTGTLEATGDGTLYFSGSVVTNTNGTISTDGSSLVDLNSTQIIGGNLTSPSGAEIHGINCLLDGVTITSGSTLSVDNGGIVNLTGGLINKGTIVIGGNSAQLTDYDSNVTLSGGGTVILSDASSIIGGNGELSPLVN